MLGQLVEQVPNFCHLDESAINVYKNQFAWLSPDTYQIKSAKTKKPAVISLLIFLGSSASLSRFIRTFHLPNSLHQHSLHISHQKWLLHCHHRSIPSKLTALITIINSLPSNPLRLSSDPLTNYVPIRSLSSLLL